MSSPLPVQTYNLHIHTHAHFWIRVLLFLPTCQWVSACRWHHQHFRFPSIFYRLSCYPLNLTITIGYRIILGCMVPLSSMLFNGRKNTLKRQPKTRESNRNKQKRQIRNYGFTFDALPIVHSFFPICFIYPHKFSQLVRSMVHYHHDIMIQLLIIVFTHFFHSIYMCNFLVSSLIFVHRVELCLSSKYQFHPILSTPKRVPM